MKEGLREIMKIVEAGTIAKTDDGIPITGIVIAASKDEIASLPFNPYGATVKLVKVESEKKTSMSVEQSRRAK